MAQPPRFLRFAATAWARPAALPAVLVPLSLIGGLLPSFSLAANLYVLLLGGAVIALGRWGALPGRPASVRPPAGARRPPSAVRGRPRAGDRRGGGAGRRPPAARRPSAAAHPAAGVPRAAVESGAAGVPRAAGDPATVALPSEVGVPCAAGPDLDPPSVAVPGRRRGAVAWWLVPALLVVAVEAVDLSLGSTYPHPTVSVLMDPPLEHHLVRAAAYLGWLAVFVGLARR
jgi:hypothetical protein